jgi:autotransporter-associated beta strand protein
MKCHVARPCAAISLFAFAVSAHLISSCEMLAETWNLGTGSSWNTATNWNPASIPNGIGASAIFNGQATALNPDQTANRTITLDGPKTVGSILFNNDLSTFTNTISTGTGGPLTFDATGGGPATINTTGSGTGNNTISVAMVLTDSLSATVDNISATSAAGSLNLTGAISGPGGFAKFGDGLSTFGTGAKTYGGPTVLNGGRMRISVAAQPSATSSFTVNTGAQLTLIAANGTYLFGNGPLILNGSGPTSGSFAIFPGAIRPDTNGIYSIANPVTLQTDTLIHVQGAATGSLTFTNSISGPGRLTLTAPASDANLGTLVLNGSNFYSGGTTINGGTLLLLGTSASLGVGEVTVNSANLMFAGASAKLSIQPGVLNAIADSATLSLAGGNSFGVADDGFAELMAGVNEIVGALFLGGVPQLPGTYGSTASSATFKDDEYFSGTGIITVIPEPSSTLIALAAAAALAGLRRRSRC